MTLQPTENELVPCLSVTSNRVPMLRRSTACFFA